MVFAGMSDSILFACTLGAGVKCGFACVSVQQARRRDHEPADGAGCHPPLKLVSTSWEYTPNILCCVTDLLVCFWTNDKVAPRCVVSFVFWCPASPLK